MALSSPGIGSNLNVTDIVSQLMAVEARPLNLLARKEANYLAKVSAFGTLKGALSTFQSTLDALKLPSKFQGVTATATDASILSGTASSKAVAGSYTVDVTKLAQAQTIATAGKATTTAPIGDGAKTTLTFQFGTVTGGKLANGVYVDDPLAVPPLDPRAFTQDSLQSGGSVVIDSTNNSLQGIRDAVNKANIGVTATIVSDGSGNPHHLVMTSNATGATSTMKISVARDAAAPAGDTALADLLAYDPAGAQNMTQSTAAQDTALTVNGIPVTARNKTVAEAIQGVSLTINKIGSTTVNVARDTSAIQNGVSSLVKAYNDLDKTIKTLTAYDPATKVGGALLGEASVRNIQSQVRTMLGDSLTGGGALTNLTQVGVTFQRDGSMALDSAKLTKAIETSFDDLAGLFASIGTSSDSLVKYIGSATTTKPGTGALFVSALATRGQVSGGAAANPVITLGSNDQLNLSVDGVSTSLTLAPNTYTAQSLAAYLQSAINGASEFKAGGVTVAVSADADGKLTIMSNRYGSASKVDVSGNAADSLVPSPTDTDGTDVAGTIDGVAATGSGQLLTAGAGSTLSGLKMEITGGPYPADRGTVSFSQGYADILTRLMDNFTSSSGLINGQTNSLQNTIKDIGKSRDALNLKLQGIEKRLTKQFTALDVTISRMTSTSNYLTQQLAQLANLSG
ncbi:flagellar filament capping protein FliD [Massilia soli]|uniref:Flagellar hook-associated protein 2 n=1 Tax=Massilia soli TaxID=2792854 RepID=A0ABS7SSV0_9BURK|nr:flagellar filament capping protein FliD [Massilia soli]MBZ2209016.1 flagellar filament capping protein FliD [Massilia soli]